MRSRCGYERSVVKPQITVVTPVDGDEAVQPMPLVPCVGAVVIDGDGRLLLVQRANPPSRGAWSVPGGRVEPGESLVEAVIREVAEETGLAVSIGRLLGVVQIAGMYEVHDFAATVTGGVLVPGDDALAARWCSPAEVATLRTTPGLVTELRRMGVPV